MRNALSFMVCFFGLVAAQGQSIQNIKAVPAENSIITITYDIVGAKPEQKFQVSLYGSHNNYRTPITLASGDIGKNITGGIGKKIIWDGSSDLRNHKGELNFQVKAEIMAMPFSMKIPANGEKVRRGKGMNIEWEGGKITQNVRLELFEGAEFKSLIAETSNSGQFTWNIPSNQRKGYYIIKLVAGPDSVTSAEFGIKSRIPVIVYPIAAVGVGAAVVIILTGGSKNKGLPGPPEP
jgi:Ser-Thr-rich glycosyl-phosphatidyl-inositol-anchored membrane family